MPELWGDREFSQGRERLAEKDAKWRQDNIRILQRMRHKGNPLGDRAEIISLHSTQEPENLIYYRICKR